MITSFLMGGLGNQMFQISAAYSYAIDNNDDAVFDLESCYTPLQGNPAKKYKNSIFKNIKNQKNISTENIYQEVNHLYKEIPKLKNLLIKGYFQSEKYFEKNKNAIIDLFHIDTENKKNLKNKYFINNKKNVSIHIRRGDYLNNPNIHPTCSMQYYKQAMSLFNNAVFIIVSDDIEWAKINFSNHNCIFSEEKDEIMDFTLLNICDDHIIANSTFSWWAAYLNRNENKKIIAPINWFGPDGPKEEIVPPEWTRI